MTAAIVNKPPQKSKMFAKITGTFEPYVEKEQTLKLFGEIKREKIDKRASVSSNCQRKLMSPKSTRTHL